MPRPLQLLPLLSRLAAPSVLPSASLLHSRRFVSRGADKARAVQSRVSRDRAANTGSRFRAEEEEEEEDVEEQLQALADAERKRRKTVKFQILRRQMTPPGAPQRKLTWEAIEQIRYLKREQPEEWTVERLAEGFSVRPDEILRVLRSKFVPPAERQARQDAKVMSELGQRVLPSGAGTGQDRPKLPANRTPAAALPPGSRGGAVVPVTDQSLMLRGESSGSLTKSPSTVSVLPAQLRAAFNKDAPATRPTDEDDSRNVNPAEEDAEDEEGWDGSILTEEELEEILDMEKPSPVMQLGKDFFDAEGNFLYRI